ncbi:response regulator [Paenibacillus eucommiae]|uniref:Two-component system response regulator YesN n=1 Tax=Paenibacillus eucommiae TaxID=1355755 RepID=A0ABS4IT47_9BACL|nr:response regulator [Paenibacillus eucommiae]MBP1990752.1 two-component system response regulator YesN [Paenibacillus eucommiae]
MYRLLIVDDEAFIVDGLANFFTEYEGLELEIYTAYSADEALEWLRRTQIDIVLSDIRMPGMSGFELQQQIMQLWPLCKVIFLTGFNDFQYVQTALRQASVDYILKTEENETIVQAVKKAVLSLESQFEMERLLQEARSQRQTAMPLLQKEFLIDLLQGEVREPALAQHIYELQLPVDAGLPVLLLLGRIDDWDKRNQRADQSLLLYAVQNISNEYLSPASRLICVTYDRSRLAWLIQPSGDADWERTVRYVTGMMEKIQMACRSFLKLTVSLLVAQSPVPWQQCAEKFQTLQSLFYMDYGMRHELLLREGALGPKSQQQIANVTGRLTLNKLSLLETYLETGQKEQFHSLFSQLLKLVPAAGDESAGVRMQFYYMVIAIYFSRLNRLESLAEFATRFDSARLTRLEDYRSWDEAMESLLSIAGFLFDQKQDQLAEREQEIVNIIKMYIEKNMSGDLSLTRIGEVVGFNPSYLSRLYKQLTGEGLSEYIVEVRLAKAKELLQQQHPKVQDISEALGFDSATYFGRFFRKLTNMTPTEYRETFIRRE